MVHLALPQNREMVHFMLAARAQQHKGSGQLCKLLQAGLPVAAVRQRNCRREQSSCPYLKKSSRARLVRSVLPAGTGQGKPQTQACRLGDLPDSQKLAQATIRQPGWCPKIAIVAEEEGGRESP